MPFPPPQELPDPGSLAGSLSLELLGKSDTLSMPLRRQYSNRYVEVVCLFAEQINNVHAIVQWGNGHRLGSFLMLILLLLHKEREHYQRLTKWLNNMTIFFDNFGF